jgi:hypothetical protein
MIGKSPHPHSAGDDFNAVDLRSLANQPPLEVAALAATVDTTKLRL